MFYYFCMYKWSINFSSTEIFKSCIEYNMCVGKKHLWEPKSEQNLDCKDFWSHKHLCLSDIQTKNVFQI